MKLKTKRKTFKTYGFDLKDPLNGKTLSIPKTLKARYDYQLPNFYQTTNDTCEQIIDKLLSESWTNRLTKNQFFRSCLICNTTSNVEMHHVRSVANVRMKFRTGNATFKNLMGAVKRKQIPLCNYHHKLYHLGELNYQDLIKIKRYTEMKNDNKS